MLLKHKMTIILLLQLLNNYDKENRLNKAQSASSDKETQNAKVPCP